MNALRSLWCRTYQTAFRIALPILPYREPTPLADVAAAAAVLSDRRIARVLLVTDATIRQLGLIDPLLEALDARGIEASIYDEVVPNPTIENVEAARERYLEDGCQAIIAFGGGSVMDCAKVCGARIVRPRKPVTKMRGILRVLRPLPTLIAIPTTAGTGSETTLAAVITDGATHYKYPINDFALIPHYAVLDYRTTLGLPPHITATTGMDALVHATEAYIGRSTTRDEDWAEIEAYRAANVNHVRTSHYPPSRHLLEACDELGMYVEEETAACFQGTGGKHIHARPEDFLGTFAEMIERDRNRPSVIIWSLGNESAFERTPAFAAELAHARAVEASRPLIFSYPYTVERMPLPYDIVSRHYEGTGGVLGAAHMPVLHDEFAHVPCYDIDELKRDPNVRSFWGHGLRAAWDGVFATDGALGVDLWSGVDDVFPLPEGTGGRWQRHSRGTWPGYGEWGAVLDCHRREKPEAFLVRKAFSPVRMDEKDFVVSGGRLLAPIINRFDHTWLSELGLVARADGRELPAEAVSVPDLAPHASGVLEVALPGDAGEVREVSLAWTLAGREVDSFVMRLRPDVAGLPAAGAGAPTPELELTPSEIRVSCANGALFRFSRRTGTLEAAEWGGRAVVVGGRACTSRGPSSSVPGAPPSRRGRPSRETT